MARWTLHPASPDKFGLRRITPAEPHLDHPVASGEHEVVYCNTIQPFQHHRAFVEEQHGTRGRHEDPVVAKSNGAVAVRVEIAPVVDCRTCLLYTSPSPRDRG